VTAEEPSTPCSPTITPLLRLLAHFRQTWSSPSISTIPPSIRRIFLCLCLRVGRAGLRPCHGTSFYYGNDDFPTQTSVTARGASTSRRSSGDHSGQVPSRTVHASESFTRRCVRSGRGPVPSREPTGLFRVAANPHPPALACAHLHAPSYLGTQRPRRQAPRDRHLYPTNRHPPNARTPISLSQTGCTGVRSSALTPLRLNQGDFRADQLVLQQSFAAVQDAIATPRTSRSPRRGNSRVAGMPVASHLELEGTAVASRLYGVRVGGPFSSDCALGLWSRLSVLNHQQTLPYDDAKPIQPSVIYTWGAGLDL